MKRSTSCHMLRSIGIGFIGDCRKSHSLVGLGIFRPRGDLVHGNGHCSDPSCAEDEEVWAVWLWNGRLVMLPFCRKHAQQHLRVDEDAEADAAAQRVLAARKQERALRAAAKRDAKKAARAAAAADRKAHRLSHAERFQGQGQGANGRFLPRST
jgi:hypothetical protein